MKRNGLTASAALLLLLASVNFAQAQLEVPPPQGKGRVVVVVSGADGADHYIAVSTQIAQLGYDAVVFDGHAMLDKNGEAMKTAIEQATKQPHALPGKVAVVGFSLGGGISLFYATRLPDLVAGVVEWYPATKRIEDIPGFAGRLQVPVLMFAGEIDFYLGCCVIATARNLAAAAKAAGKPFELVSYPNTGHDFVYGAGHYNPQSYQDAFQRMGARLKDYIGN
jgi:dienelactone hydrolase